MTFMLMLLREAYEHILPGAENTDLYQNESSQRPFLA